MGQSPLLKLLAGTVLPAALSLASPALPSKRQCLCKGFKKVFFTDQLSGEPFFCFGDTGVWTHSLLFARQVRYHLSHSSGPLCSGYFQDKVSLFAGLDHDPSILCFLHSWDDRCMPPQAAIGQDGVSWTFCQGWFWTAILLISATQTARIIDVSHQCLARRTIFEKHHTVA
jgi:hypothetical protein